MKPAPPETTARGFISLLAADSSIGEAVTAHDGRVVDVAAIDDDGFGFHRLLDSVQVQETELVPLSDDDERVRSLRDLIRIVHVCDVGQELARAFHGRGIVSAHRHARAERHLWKTAT